ncbi:MAG: STAS domain-containing protein [Vicinamibacterales bacterium]
MPLDQRLVNDIVVLDLSGRFTLESGAGRVKERIATLLAEDRTRFVLNLSQLTAIDSAGLGELVTCYSSVMRKGGTVKLAALASRVREVLVVTKLVTVFDVYDTEADALASFGRG